MPESAPTKSKINKAPVTDLNYPPFLTSSHKIFFLKSIMAAIAPPISNINWFDPFNASSP